MARVGKARTHKSMMNGQDKADPAIVAMKPAKKAAGGSTSAAPQGVESRAWAEESVGR